MGPLKFTVFSDLHHHPAWYKADAPERLTAIQERALESGSEFILHLGDFSHKPSACPDLIRQFREFPLPGYFVLGNHEFDIDSYETVLQSMGLDAGYYFFDHGGFRFIVLDENYFSDFPGICFHYSERNYFDHPAGRDWMPQEEIQWLRETVQSSPYPCILASHAPIVYAPSERGGMKCGQEVDEIIRGSRGTPGEVILCLNGHHHRSGLDVINGVPRLDVNSASFNWVPVPHDLFPEKEWYHIYECLGNMIIFEKPVSAEIILDPETRTIEVIGTGGDFLHGISTEISGNDSGARLSTADMISCKVPWPEA
ncbi:MAG: metallophosphoesterase [Lentisphaeria bacterium]|nr:metallophosphoesterase [Lentisphaeria bacterium]